MDLKAKPFYLSDEEIRWVQDTLRSMTLEEKVGQLFCPVGTTSNEAELGAMLAKIKPAGMMFRPGPAADIQKTHRFLQDHSKVPLLLAANLEAGGVGVASDGTLFGSQMQVAATDNEDFAYKLGLVSSSEGAAVGVNWAFAPVCDIDNNFRNPITNVRTYGSDPERVLRMTKAYLRGCHENGTAVSIKHFPGDGVDERDQHLLASVNSLSVEEWNNTYGVIYRGLIEAGAQTVMVGHIMQPAYERMLNPALKDEEIMPGTLSPELLQGLLRGILGFNGMITTDATSMAGYTAMMKREDAVPYSIAAGCDMFLFNQGLDKDFEYMMNGIRRGILTEERVDEAVTRTLALKASLKLHVKQAEHRLVPQEDALSVIGCEKHKQWAAECADHAVTLVKNKENLLPISPVKHKRILLHVLGDQADKVTDMDSAPMSEHFRARLEQEGFEVTRFDPSNLPFDYMFRSVEELVSPYDLVLYYANVGTYSNQTVVRINWAPPMGANVPKFVKNIPTMFISVGNPYHLLDVPMVKTFINAYTSSQDIVDALIEKIMGRSEFKGISPVDPFCGRWDTTL